MRFFIPALILLTLSAQAVQFNLNGQIRASTAAYADSAGYATTSGVAGAAVDSTARANVVTATNTVMNQLGSTDSGTEGWTRIGAIGGYELDEFIEDTAIRGPARDLPTFIYTRDTTNLTVTWSGGDIYDPYTGYHHLDSGTKVLVNDAVNYAYWATNDYRLVQWTTGTRPSADTIYLATFAVSQTNIVHAGVTIPTGDALLYEDVAFANILPSIITEGVLCYATATNLTNIVLSSGVEYHNMGDRIQHAEVNLAVSTQLTYYGHSAAGVWTKYQTNQFPLNLCDTGTVVSVCEPEKWYRGLFIAPPDTNHLHFILPDSVYTSAVDAITGTDPDLPPGMDPYIPRSTAYIYMGSDTCLRVESAYWVDVRRMIRYGTGNTVISTGGGSTTIPTLGQVLAQGRSTAGILPSGAGFPVTDDELTSKGYVDSLRNKASTGSAYVDPVNGDDVTGRIEKGSLPFKTIQAAIDACAAAASDTRRFLVMASIGTYVEDITMKNFVGLRGLDIESVVIRGQITYPAAYTDLTGGELQVLTIYTTNRPAIVYSPGADKAYTGLRSCAVYATWTNTAAVMPVYQIERGQFQVYATTWSQNDVPVELGDGVICVYYGTTNAANLGTYALQDFAGSHVINCVDSNATIGVAYSDAAQDSLIQLYSCQSTIWLDDATNHVNKVKLGYMKGGNGGVDMRGGSVDLKLHATNDVVVIAAASEGAVAARRGSGVHVSVRLRGPNVGVANNFVGSATTANDYAEAYGTQLSPQTTNYPAVYTADGALGSVVYQLNHGGDLLVSGGIDLSANVATAVVPSTGHLKLYTSPTVGLEQPYFVDSSGAKYRIGAAGLFNALNAETTTLTVGTAVYISQTNSQTASNVKRAKADSLDTMPCVGVVCQPGGIAAGAVGRVFRMGRTEFGLDTSMWSPGQKLYLSATVAGALTNVEPVSPYVSQLCGWAHISNAASGTITMHAFAPDTLGNQLPAYYGSAASVSAVADRATALESRAAALEGRTNLWNTASTTSIDATNRVTVLEGRTNAWNQAAVAATAATNLITFYHTAKRFKATVGNANITYAGSLTVTPFTNVVLAASGGSIYSNGLSVAQWWPKATNGVVKLQGSWGAVSANSATYKVHVYKNGQLLSDVYNFSAVLGLGNTSMGTTWNFVDTTTPTVNDYYQVYTTFNATRLSVNAGSNNWWYGEVSY